nr:hypothetical protein [Bacillota bacterium]
MKVEMEGKRLNVSSMGLLRMARDGRIQPWFSIKSDELTGGKWMKAGDLAFFAGVWAQRKDLARSIGASRGVALEREQRNLRREASAHEPHRAAARGRSTGALAQTAERISSPAGGVESFELHGVRVDYKVSCPKCKSTLTKLGVTHCPRCGKRIAASKQLYWLKTVLYSLGMVIIFAGAILLKKFGQWAKYVYPAAGILLGLLSVVAQGAKFNVTVWVNGHPLPSRQMVLPLGEYYSPKVWSILARRIASLFRLNAILRRMAEREELGTETGASPPHP